MGFCTSAKIAKNGGFCLLTSPLVVDSLSFMRIHFIAIGGAVMHNLALELQALGHQVSGSDDEIFDPARSRLAAAGLLPPEFGWFPERVEGVDQIIVGMHARADNPELLRAQECQLPVFSFPSYIYEHAKEKTRVVIAGSHGKTTSTAMLMHVLHTCGLDFDYLVGSQLPGYQRMVHLSNAPVMLIEGDEYLTSPLDPRSKFMHYKPHLTMITGIAWDHINVFPTEEMYQNQFDSYLGTCLGPAYVYQGDPALVNIAKHHAHAETYQAPMFGYHSSGEAWVQIGDEAINLSFYGKHNMENAAGVVRLAQQLGIGEIEAWKALSTFPGTAKRLETIAETNRGVLIRDFAHAPSKVAASVAAVRERHPNDSILALLELHTFSSLNPTFMPRYSGTLNPADERWVLYDPHVFALKKMEIPSTQEMQARLGSDVRLFSDADLLEQALKENSSQVWLIMSSGNVGGLDLKSLFSH
jgi:UDP-N-acetylmuramate: L-alanyl-gamma-D-glutamyl-meso-diaminopimelate ligase